MPNTFDHCELSTDDVTKAQKFYKGLFDWKFQSMMDGAYQMIETGKGMGGGGLQKKPMPEQPNAWMPYVTVADVKKTIAKAKKLGALAVPLEFQAIGDMGAIGIFIDPTGAALGVWAPAAKTPARKAAKKGAKKAAKKAKKRGR
jgi:predicted enzyme related to lactoylglutathione lyase